MSVHQKLIIFGSFNAERFWRNPLHATMPSFNDDQANTIVEAMDEMQFVFSKAANSLVITRFAMNHAHLQYLSELGFIFDNIGLINNLSIGQDITIKKSATVALLEKLQDDKRFAFLKKEPVKLDPYAIVPEYLNLTELLDTQTFSPAAEAVKKVNSKVFSTDISAEIRKGSGGCIVNSAEELQQQAEIMLKNAAVIIKDPFGVSGNGNILIKKELSLRSVVKHLLNQEQSGKIIQFVLEPYLDKQTDFSCQAVIDQSGNCEIISFHIMHNEKFRFSGIERASESFVREIELSGYIEYITAAAKSIFKAGYFGPVCIDSMILTNGELIPIVEINARKSMGLINHFLFTFITEKNKHLKCRMMTLSFLVNYRLSFEEFLDKLRLEGLLYFNGGLSGILPLSANTVDINARLIPEGPFKGRLYYHIIYTTITDLDALQEKMYNFCEKSDLKIL